MDIGKNGSLEAALHRSPSKQPASLDSRDLYPITRVEGSPRPGQADLVTRVQDSADLDTRVESRPSPSTLPRRPSARVATPTYRYGIIWIFFILLLGIMELCGIAPTQASPLSAL